MGKTNDQALLARLRQGENLPLRDQLTLIINLSIPAIMAQISSTIMQYIDASMVGQLGAADSASIGLTASSTWLLGGVANAMVVGFTVQIAHRIGAGEEREARRIMLQALLLVLLYSSACAAIGAAVSDWLPHWLGGSDDICKNASIYFLIVSLSQPIRQINNVAAGSLQCSGNMKVPSILLIIMCGLDVVFNFFLIFPTRSLEALGMHLLVPGAGMGVAGAALGTALSILVCMILMLYFLLIRSEALHLRRGERPEFVKADMITAVKIAVPVALDSAVMSGAYVMATKIVAPLGTVAIAANSFAVTAEGLCYMPGYGIGSAATTITGQSIGAGRKDMTKRLGWLTTWLGVGVMTLSAGIMFFGAPLMIGFLTPDPAVRALGTVILRIEAFAEPMYGASIVVAGVFKGAGDTLSSTVLNAVSMWCVRIPLSMLLVGRFGLQGVWVAMCLELNFRGIIFLGRLVFKKFDKIG